MSDFGPKSKDTLASVVIKILKQGFWQLFRSFQICNVMVFVNNRGHYSPDNFEPRSKNTLAFLVVKIIKQ